MKEKKKPVIRLSERGFEIKFGKLADRIDFEQMATVLPEQRTAGSAVLNAVKLSEEMYLRMRSEKLLLVHPESGRFSEVIPERSDFLTDNQIQLSERVRERLYGAGEEPNGELFLCACKKQRFNQIQVQKIDHIREDDLVVSKYDSDGHLFEFSQGFSLFEVCNSFTGESFVVKRSHIVVDPAIEGWGVIRLNRKQRLLLGLELPGHLSDRSWALLMNRLSESRAADRTALEAAYTPDEHLLREGLSYRQKQEAKKVLNSCFPSEVRLTPVPVSFGYRPGRSLGQKLSDFYVGAASLLLACRRPRENDEGMNVVRLSKSNMNLLGISEMDSVILRYKNRSCRCRVLAFEDQASFSATNLPLSFELAVGVPAHVRYALAIPNLSAAVKVERDTGFIFRKSFHEQVVPILLTLFSFNLFRDLSALWSAVGSLVAIPFVVWFNLSSKRNIRSKK